MGGIWEIILKLIPIFSELIGNKAKAGTDALAAMACWQSTNGRAAFSVQVLLSAISKQVITTPAEVGEAAVALQFLASITVGQSCDAAWLQDVFLDVAYTRNADNSGAMSALVDKLTARYEVLSQAA